MVRETACGRQDKSDGANPQCTSACTAVMLGRAASRSRPSIRFTEVESMK